MGNLSTTLFFYVARIFKNVAGILIPVNYDMDINYKFAVNQMVVSRNEFRVTEKMKLKVEEKLKTMLKCNQDLKKRIWDLFFRSRDFNPGGL